MWSETGMQEVAKLKWLQGRKKTCDAVDRAEKMLQIDRKKAGWKAKKQMSHFAIQEVGFFSI